MAFDIKKKINDIVEKIKGDPKLMEEFKENPEKAIEKVVGIDIPYGLLDKVVDGVKAKLTGDKLSDMFGSIKKLF